MRNLPPLPVGTIELLLAEIAARLRRRAVRPLSAVVVATILAACGSAIPVVPPPASDVALAPRAERDLLQRTLLDTSCTGDAGTGTPFDCPATSPACGLDGRCVACRTPAHCAVAALACHDGSCGACTTDDECASGRCLGDGTCLALTGVAYVDHGHTCRDEPHASSAADPYCEIAPALPSSGVAVVRVAPSVVPYEPFAVDARAPLDVTVLGPGPLGARIEAAEGDAIRYRSDRNRDARLAVRGFTVVGGRGAAPGSAVSCGGSSDHAALFLSDVVLADSGGRGLFAYGCTVEVVRSTARDNAGRGLELYGASYLLDGDFMFGNGGAGLSLSNASGIATHLTITGNHTTHDAGGVLCDGAHELTDSIVVDNASPGLTGDDAQVDPRCLVTRTALGTGSLRGLACTPRFVATDDPHLDRSSPAADAVNRACAIDHGAGSRTRPDIDGQPTEGAASDLGADETT